jgi:hypothetical protein
MVYRGVVQTDSTWYKVKEAYFSFPLPPSVLRGRGCVLVSEEITKNTRVRNHHLTRKIRDNENLFNLQ